MLVFPERVGVGGAGRHQDSGWGSWGEVATYRYDPLINATDR